MKKLMSMVLASALLLAVLTGCGFTGSSTQSPSGGSDDSSASGTRDTLVYYDSNEIRTLVQWDASDTQSFTILNNAFEGLFRLDANHEPQPALAESYTVSDDGLVYTFTLREGLQWSNGTPLTASDFVFSWLKQMSSDATNGYNFIMTDYIVNGLEYGEGTATADQVGVKALDDRTLEVTIKNPTPYFLYLTTLSMYFPLNEAYVTEQGDNYGITADNMIYCGPYTITSYDPAVGTSMVKNETYWDAANVSIPKVEVKIIKDQSSALNTYLAGSLDKVNLSSADVPTYQNDPEFHTVTEFRSTYLQFNLDDPAMANLNIRKALGYAIDRSILADTILGDGSTAAEGLVSFGVSGDGTKTFRELNGNLSPFDADKAKEYWAKGVEELGYTPELSMLIADDSATKQIATFVQSQFRDNLGIEVAIDSKTSKARNELMDNNNYQFAITAWGADYDDAMTFLDLWIAQADTGKSTPYRGNYANATYTDLITSAKADANSETRLQSLLDAEKLLVDTDAVISPLYFKGFAYLQRSDVQNLIVHPLGNPVEFKYASFSTAE